MIRWHVHMDDENVVFEKMTPPRRKPTALTPKSLALLRDEGWQVAVVEKWNSHAKVRVDLYGFVDVLGVSEAGTIAVQVCRRADIATRAKKIADHENVGAVRKAGWTIEVHGWDLHEGRWRVKREVLS